MIFISHKEALKRLIVISIFLGFLMYIPIRGIHRAPMAIIIELAVFSTILFVSCYVYMLSRRTCLDCFSFWTIRLISKDLLRQKTFYFIFRGHRYKIAHLLCHTSEYECKHCKHIITRIERSIKYNDIPSRDAPFVRKHIKHFSALNMMNAPIKLIKRMLRF